jgi:serine/threonine-protein kinase
MSPALQGPRAQAETQPAPDAASRALLLRPGDVLDGTYEVLRPLGAGSMGQVFEALDRGLQRRVAIKVAHAASDAASLVEEARALAAVRHPGMVTVHALGRWRSMDYLVMERLYGTRLYDLMTQRFTTGEDFAVAEVVEVLIALAETLAAVHAAGLAHRDVKPENIMRTQGRRLVLLDLGVSLPEFAFDPLAEAAGTPVYMAPEALVHKVPHGGGYLLDLYGLGVLAYELLTTALPYDAGTLQELVAIHFVTERPPDVRALRPDTPDALAELIASLLARDPGERPATAEALLWQLRGVQSALSAGTSYAPLPVLVVDDEPESAAALGRYVSHTVAHVEVRTATTAAEALAAARAQPPALILLDLEMPEMNGLELAMCLRGDGLVDGCTIVAVSGHAHAPDVSALAQLGVSHFISKNVDFDQHLAPILRAVRRRASYAPRELPPLEPTRSRSASTSSAPPSVEPGSPRSAVPRSR